MINVVRAVLALLVVAMLVMASQSPEVGLRGVAARTGQDVPILASPHIHLGQRHVPYNSLPPTSGPHWPDTVGPGIYREELPEEIQVHVLEHGHVLLQYAPELSRSDIRALERLGRRYPRDVVVAPYAKLAPYARRGEGIALTAWARIDRLASVDESAIGSFVRAFSGRYNHGEWHGDAPGAAARGERSQIAKPRARGASGVAA